MVDKFVTDEKGDSVPMTAYIALLRPQQWLKNMFVFLPLFFDGRLTDATCLVSAGIACASFCLAASSVYCINDICDCEADRLHPLKCRRPIAAGKVGRRTGYALAFALLLVSTALPALLPGGKETAWKMAALVLSYYAMNIGYCFGLKRVAIVDVFIIAAGFVMRVVAGGFSTHVHLTHWIILMTFLLALFLAFAKRRDDVMIRQSTGVTVRSAAKQYTPDFLNQILAILASVTIVCYIMYSVSDEVIVRMGSPYVYLTSVFVLAGIIRYLQITLVDGQSGSPTRILLKDRFIQACLALWIIGFLIIIYVL
ncbi:MAG: decaprenyl-phosphate phosphoribosyltransferase [Tannerella sp.]|jgi:4-hydroxybenzoate polyprenyltransferase|nr:decaprenyl-phosphate phosphoribosyltransferase [Tannerella sp.]